MLRVNLEVCTETLRSVRVNAFHLHPVVCLGWAALLHEAGVNQFSAKTSVTELLNSGHNEILLLDIESIHGLDSYSISRLEQDYAPKAVVVATPGQLVRLGGRLPTNIGSLVSPRGALENFVRAIVAVARREAYVDPSLLATWHRIQAAPSIELTSRQLEVLHLVAEGKTSVQIAGMLGVRPKTVENHRAAIKDRMRVVSAAEMINEAHKRGIC